MKFQYTQFKNFMNNIDVDGIYIINFVFNFNKPMWFKDCETNVFFH